jgi:4,5-DOPA dioxygenase extradiol
MPVLPTLFISHGAPTILLDDAGTARTFLAGLGERLPRPQAVLVVTAHWETAVPTVGGAERPETIYDFWGFPEVLYDFIYPAPGAPDVAARAAELLTAARIAAARDDTRGFDHGTWVPLFLLYPLADVPVVQLSVQPAADPAAHLAVGRALAPLRGEGVMVMGSGSAVHNLADFRPGATGPAPWARAFDDWLAAAVEASDEAGLLAYRTQAATARQAHPRDEHLLPLFVALGAAGPDWRGRVLHRGFSDGSVGMSAFAFTGVGEDSP